MKSLVRNSKVEVAAGMLVLLTCFIVHMHIKDKVAEATPKCDNGTCVVEIPNTQEYRLAAICDMADQSDTLMISCVFDYNDPAKKKACFRDVLTMDKEVLKLQTAYKADFDGDFPTCPDAFRQKWKGAKHGL